MKRFRRQKLSCFSPDDLLLSVEMTSSHVTQVRPGGLGELHQTINLELHPLAHQVGWNVVELALHGEPGEHLEYECFENRVIIK